MKKVFEIMPADTGNIIQPVLHIRVGEKHYAAAIADHASGELKLLSYYLDEEGVTAETVKEALEKDSIRSYSFYKIKIGYDHAGNVLVPAAGFRHEDASMIRSSGPAAPVMVTEHIPEWQLYNVYPVPGDIHVLITGSFPSAKCWHQATIGLKHIHAASSAGVLLVDIRHTDLAVIAARSGKLLLAQNYEYSTPEDIIYYLLKICAQFSLSQDEVQVDLSGLIDRSSALYKDLYQYFAQVQFRDASWKMKNNDHPAHFFTSLNDLVKCVS